MLFRQAGSLAHRDSSREYLAGISAMCRGKRDEALRSFERALGLEPSNDAFRHGMGICLFRSGLYTDALAIFEDILSERQGDIVSLAYCCEIAILLGRMTDAAEYVDGILAENPDDYYGLARRVALDGRNGEAGKEERARLRHIAGQFEQLARMTRGGT